MRSEKLQDAIGLIKDEYILEAHGYESSGSAEAAAEVEDSRAGRSGFKTGTVLAGDFRPGSGQSKDALSVEAKERKDAGRARRRLWYRLGTVAACLAVAIALGKMLKDNGMFNMGTSGSFAPTSSDQQVGDIALKEEKNAVATGEETAGEAAAAAEEAEEAVDESYTQESAAPAPAPEAPEYEEAAAEEAPAEEVAEEPAEEVAEEPAEEPASWLPNPIHDLAPEKFTAESGIRITLPEGSTDENWYAIDAADATEAPLYGVTYTYEGNEYDLRVQKTEEFQDISGMYFDWEHYEGENDPPDVAIDRVCTIQWNETGEGVCLWPEEDLSFSISMTEGATPDRLAEMFDLVQPNIRIGE